MPTTRTRRRRSFKPAVTDTQWRLLHDETPGPDIGLGWEVFAFEDEAEEPPWPFRGARSLWGEYANTILEEWVPQRPGTRPSCWWRFSAPRQPAGNFPDCSWDGKLPLVRQRIGGIGTPRHEVLPYRPSYWCGVPAQWMSMHVRELFMRPGDYAGALIDRANPPMFEAQASFLDRHGLLPPDERRRLRADDFKPQAITDIIDFTDDDAVFA